MYPVNTPHYIPKYTSRYGKPLPRLKIYNIEPELQELVMQKHGVLEDGVLVDATVEYNPFDDIKVADIKCDCDNKILYEQLFGEVGDQEDEVMAYKTCKHTIFAAAKRQMKAAPTPDEKVANDFVKFAQKCITEDLEGTGDELQHFGYSYQQWYNHLERKKQNDMDLVAKYYNHKQLTRTELKRVTQTHYEGICKIELQKTDGKPRMVCSIPLQTKYIMGPVTWRLEEIFAKHVKGYCGGKNLDEMADFINEYIKQGFTKIVEGDGSAFDNTQDVALKEVDRWLYRQVQHSIYHVDPQKFKQVSQEWVKTMDVCYLDRTTKKKRNMFSYDILGTVFSGDCDTTLCNTIRMAMYNRYVNEKAGLKWGEDYICFAKGDDFTVMYKPEISDETIHKLYYNYFLPANPDPSKPDTRQFGLGQVLKMLDIGGPEIIKFCSLRAWFKNNDEIILTRNPEKFYNLAKYSRKTKVMTVTQKIEYCLQQAIALESSYAGINIFDEMARAYRYKAKMLAQINKTTRKQMKIIENKCIEILARRTETLENPKEDNNYKVLYNVKYREEKTVHKIIDGYWETVKRFMMARNNKLDIKELKLINQQIDNEFSCKELRSVLGLDKSNA